VPSPRGKNAARSTAFLLTEEGWVPADPEISSAFMIHISCKEMAHIVATGRDAP
jgi:hypothetical protein